MAKAQTSPRRRRQPVPVPTRPRIDLLTLGDELLLGLTPNGHLTFIGQQLARRGAALDRCLTLTDDATAIAAALRRSWREADVVITTGGLGPTCDDRTREAVAKTLGQKLVFDPRIEKAIRERFARIGRPMTDNNLKQAWRPERAEVLANPNGTAPGLWVQHDRKVLVMLPGPPNELQPMFLEQVLPRLAKLGFVGRRENFVQLRTAGIGESALETKLGPLLATAPFAAVAYCAHQGAVDVRLSPAHSDVPLRRVQALARKAAALLGSDFVCFGDDSLGKVVCDLLRNGEGTLAVAESCTGGLLSNSFTDLCGASKFFAGGVACYNNDSKVHLLGVPECLLCQHGAVSAECAVAMATGVAEKLSADYGLAITGFAGPGGGTAENPVGTIYLGLHTPEGTWVRRLNYPGPRVAVKMRAVNAALDWLRRELQRQAPRGSTATVPALAAAAAR
jgi:nicotinamide-nucleotide amidase